jgi:serine/threonine protein kinase
LSKRTGEAFAGKFIKKVGLRCVRRDEIQRELDVMNAVHSRRVAKLWDGFETAEFVVLMLDLATGGELFDYLAEKDTLTEDEAAKFTRHILEGIDCMHEKNIVHLDLKPENIMLKDRNKSEVIIIDLGLARDLNQGEVKVICGTPEFMAPEVLNYDPVTLATDMWAVGVIVYIMLSGCSPFLGDDDAETMANVSNGHYEFYEEYFNEVSATAKDFIKRLLRIRPKDRCSVSECLTHSWIKPKRGKAKRSRSQIDTARLRRFNARQRWQATMQAVKLSLRMRISIGSASSWINSHRSDSLSSDSLSSDDGDSRAVKNKREPSVPSSEYSDSVFMSPARQLTPGGNMKKSVYGLTPLSNESDDDTDNMYSKADTMAKVHQLIESRSLKPTLGQSEALTQTVEEIGNSYYPSSSASHNVSSEEDRKVLTQLNTPPALIALSETSERANVDGSCKANTDPMGDAIADATVLSLQQQVGITQEQFKEIPRSREQNGPNGFPVLHNPNIPDSVYCPQVEEPHRDSRTHATVIADREVPTEPSDDKRTRLGESNEKPFSRAQKLRHSIIKKLKRSTSSLDKEKSHGRSKRLEGDCGEKLIRSSSFVDKERSCGKGKKLEAESSESDLIPKKLKRAGSAIDKKERSHGKGKKLEGECGESDGKLEKQKAHLKAAESTEKKKKKIDVVCAESDGRLEKQQAQFKAGDSTVKKKQKVEVELDNRLEKRQTQSKAAESTDKKKRKVEEECTEPDGKAAKQKGETVADESTQKKKPKKVIRIVKRVVKRKVPKGTEADRAESDKADTIPCEPEIPVAEKRKTGTAKEGLSRLIRKFSFNRGTKSNKPIVTRNRNAHDDGETTPGKTTDEESEDSSPRIVSGKRFLDIPRSPLADVESKVMAVEHHEEDVKQNEQGGNRRLGHRQEDSGKLNSGCSGSSMPLKDRSSKSDTALLSEKNAGESAQETGNPSSGRRRFARWESEQRVSVRERIQMYQNQMDKVDEQIMKPKSDEHLVKSLNGSKGLSHSGSVSNLKEKYEMCASIEKLDTIGGPVQYQGDEHLAKSLFGSKTLSHSGSVSSLKEKYEMYASTEKVDTAGGSVQPMCKQGVVASPDRSKVVTKSLIPSVIIDQVSDIRQFSSAPVTPVASPEPEDTKRIQKFRHQARLQGSDDSVDDLTSSKCQCYDSWRNTGSQTRMKSESPTPTSKEKSVTVSVSQKAQTKEPGMSTDALQGVKEWSTTDWKAKEREKIKQSTGVYSNVSAMSSEFRKTSARQTGAKTESAEAMGSNRCPDISSRTSVTNSQGEPQQQWNLSKLSCLKSTSAMVTKTKEAASCKPESKVTSENVSSRIVQWQAKGEVSGRDSFGRGYLKAAPTLGHSVSASTGVSAPQINVNKRSLSGGKSSTMIRMSFSVQK